MNKNLLLQLQKAKLRRLNYVCSIEQQREDKFINTVLLNTK